MRKALLILDDKGKYALYRGFVHPVLGVLPSFMVG